MKPEYPPKQCKFVIQLLSLVFAFVLMCVYALCWRERGDAPPLWGFLCFAFLLVAAGASAGELLRFRDSWRRR
jgi:pilus assembly protein TadC